MKIAGIVLVIVGLVALAMGRFSFTTTEKVAEVGPIDVTHEKTHTETIPVVAGLAAVGAGGVMLFAGSRKRAA